MKCELSIYDHGRRFRLDYQGLMAFHGGGAVAGATIGFRAVQAAANELARFDRNLERESISVVSGHPGPGYQDAFEYTLRSVSRSRFTLNRDLPEARHSPFHDYAFQFIFMEQELGKEISVTLKADILPTRFFEILRDLKRQEADSDLNQELADQKHAIARKVMAASLTELFGTRIRHSSTR